MGVTVEKVELTQREKEVLKYVSKGLTNKQIANILFVSDHTVKAHIASIIRKLGVTNRLNATVAGFAKGLIDKE